MKISIRKIDIWKYLFLYLIFQPSLSDLINSSVIGTIIKYSDEAIGVLMVMAVLFSAMKSEITLIKFERYMLIFMLIFEIIGIVSGSKYKYQNISYMLIDAYTCSKFFIYYLCARLLTQGKLTQKYFFSVNTICKIIAVVFCILAIHDAFLVPWFEVRDFRFFANSVCLFFGHPESLARACITVIFLLAYNYKYYKHNIYYIAMLTVVMILTFRTKAIVAVFVLFVFYIYFVKFNFRSLIPVGIASVAGAGYFGYDSFTGYYLEADFSPRQLMTQDSVILANKFFPYGTGFGSYASSMAAQHYSKLYLKLGYDRIKGSGLQEGKYGSFLSDTFWPIVIAQTGWIGLISFCLAILSMIIYILNARKTDVYYFWVAISIIIYDLISSFAAPAFFYPSAIAPFLFLGLITSIHEFPKKESK